jgi:metal-responsive CopG/Arc/MetJ family transcriptional regulator
MKLIFSEYRMAKRKGRQIPVQFTDEMLEAIDIAISIGAAANRSDLIRVAVFEKLTNLSVYGEMKKRKTANAK